MSHSNERHSRVAPRADRSTTTYSATIAACVDAQARASASEAAGAYLDKLTSATSAIGSVEALGHCGTSTVHITALTAGSTR